MLLLNFLFNKSFLNNFIIIPVGVTTKKKINAITTGEISNPNSSPNLNQIVFKGVKIFEFNKPNIRKAKEIIMDQILGVFSFSNGQRPIIKKTVKNTKPKLLLVLFLILSFFDIIY